MKLLIVEDHAGVRALIRQLVTPPATAVRECACAVDAVATAREFAPDIVLMDVRLPDVDGIEATRILRAECPAVRVVIVTAYDHPAVRRSALAAGASHFLLKDNLPELPDLLARLAADASAPRPKK